jgi:hypothetical protein
MVQKKLERSLVCIKFGSGKKRTDDSMVAESALDPEIGNKTYRRWRKTAFMQKKLHTGGAQGLEGRNRIKTMRTSGK